jgi:hypothetical protein
MANAELRAARSRAHAAFDPMWRGAGWRTHAYKWLAAELGIAPEVCHISMMDVAMCERVVEACARYFFQHREPGETQ